MFATALPIIYVYVRNIFRFFRSLMNPQFEYEYGGDGQAMMGNHVAA